jgi:FkbM family methyltransferase
MPTFTGLKKVSLSLGLYGPARYLYRHVLNRKKLAQLEAEAEFFRNLKIPRKCLCFDVGANIGEKTEALLTAGYSVVAFEPQADCVMEIKARCDRFGESFRVKQSAVGARVGESILHVRSTRGLSSLSDDWNQGEIETHVTVPVTTLDTAIAEFGVPGYVKIDVEGWEIEVLKGLSQPVSLLSFEYHLIEGGPEAAWECLDYLARFGAIKINITPSEALTLGYADWVTLDEFKRRFPAEYIGRKDWFYGDIFVKISS